MMLSWLEERRYEWSPVVGNAIAKILEGQTVIILTDEQNQWFEKYIIQHINRPGMSRPLLPFFSLMRFTLLLIRFARIKILIFSLICWA